MWISKRRLYDLQYRLAIAEGVRDEKSQALAEALAAVQDTERRLGEREREVRELRAQIHWRWMTTQNTTGGQYD